MTQCLNKYWNDKVYFEIQVSDVEIQMEHCVVIKSKNAKSSEFDLPNNLITRTLNSCKN